MTRQDMTWHDKQDKASRTRQDKTRKTRQGKTSSDKTRQARQHKQAKQHNTTQTSKTRQEETDLDVIKATVHCQHSSGRPEGLEADVESLNHHAVRKSHHLLWLLAKRRRNIVNPNNTYSLRAISLKLEHIAHHTAKNNESKCSQNKYLHARTHTHTHSVSRNLD